MQLVDTLIAGRRLTVTMVTVATVVVTCGKRCLGLHACRQGYGQGKGQGRRARVEGMVQVLVQVLVLHLG